MSAQRSHAAAGSVNSRLVSRNDDVLWTSGREALAVSCATFVTVRRLGKQEKVHWWWPRSEASSRGRPLHHLEEWRLGSYRATLTSFSCWWVNSHARRFFVVSSVDACGQSR